MLCKIADLIVDVPEAGGLAPRLRGYQCESTLQPDIEIREEDYRRTVWKGKPYSMYCYMESGARFYSQLLLHQGLMLHASAIAYDGRAYLFSGDSGVGKSTHTRLWQESLGKEAIVINDDKPALRFVDGRWYAYGTPWCGKDGINQNMKVPLAGICFLEQGKENRIFQLSNEEALSEIIPRTIHRLNKAEKIKLMLSHIDSLLTNIPIFKLVNQPDAEAARLSYETMKRAAIRLGL